MLLRDMVARLGGDLVGNGDIAIRQVAPIESAGPDQLAVVGRESLRRWLGTTQAGALIVAASDRGATALPHVVSDNPLAYFARASALLNPPPPVVPGVHPLAAVDPSAKVSPLAAIGSFCSVGRDAVIGDGVSLGPGCHVGDGVRIGRDSRLHANVTIYHGCIVGQRVVLHSGCVIGADGFGGALENGRWIKIPQIGRVVIGDDVEIGANTCVDRGTMEDTVIEEGAKLDNQIQVAHNVRIGAHTAIAGCAGIAGSARIGAGCVIGGAAMIAGHLEIADGVIVSAGTLITRSLTERGRYTGIYPFESHREWLRSASRLRRLAESTGSEAPPTREHRRKTKDRK